MPKNRKLIGVVGASGTGKTQLCESSGFTFIRTSVSKVYKDFGLDPKERMTLATRLQVQRQILAHHLHVWQTEFEKYKDKNIIFVTDRTPICFMTYLLAEVSGYDQISEEDRAGVMDYVHRCYDALTWHFDGIYHLMMSEPFKSVDLSDGKVRATHDPAYHTHYQALSLGLTVDNLHQSRWYVENEYSQAVRVNSLRNFVGQL